MTRPPVSIVVPVYNGGVAFDSCLTALTALDPPPADIVIVDDHSTDGSANRAVAAGFRVLRTSGRGGPASARNLGASKTSSDILLFVDADVIVPRDLVLRVSAALTADPTVAAVIGCYDEHAPDQGFFTQYKNLYQRYVHQRARREAFTFWGACGAIRRPVFEALGGFDPEYARASIEDIEFGYRLRDNGHRIVLDSSIEVTHAKRWTARLLMRSDILHRALPWTRLILRSKRMDNDLNLGWAHRAAVLLAMTMAASIVLAPLQPSILGLAAITAGGLGLIDARLAAYFAVRRGAWFTVRAIGWQWFHYVYSGLAFGLALTLYAVRRQAARHPARSNASVESV
jgi:GT2 family glycosyltransferase